MIRDYMPWVTEEEQATFVEKLIETKDWIDEKMKAQESRPLHERPVFTSIEVDEIMTLL